MNAKFNQLVLGALCVALAAALPLLASCSSTVTALGTLVGQSSSAEAESVYYLGIDGEGYLALYKGQPGDGSDPIKTTDVLADDLHPSVVNGLEEGISFESYAEAVQRIREYEAAAEKNASARAAEGAAAEEEAAGNADSRVDVSEGEGGEGAPADPAPAEPAPAEPPAPESVVADQAASADAKAREVDAAQDAARQAEADRTAERSAPADQASAGQSTPQQVPAQEAQQPAASTPSADETAPSGEFWGVWLDNFNTLDAANACAEEAKGRGFSPEVFEIPSWRSSSGATYYVVGVGQFRTKSEAQATLDRAVEKGYKNAYLHTATQL